MNIERQQQVLTYRLERAAESLQAAQLLIDHALLIPAMNRVYYAMFYAVQALLVIQEVAFSKHDQVKGYFNREYIKTGVFPVKFGKLYNKVFEYRHKFDYVDLAMPDEMTVRDYLKEAETFTDHIRDYIQTKRVQS
jgi:uncharacterized protein (UPF0332 family)